MLLHCYYRCKSLDVLIITDLLKDKLKSESQQVVLVSNDIIITSCDAYNSYCDILSVFEALALCDRLRFNYYRGHCLCLRQC